MARLMMRQPLLIKKTFALTFKDIPPAAEAIARGLKGGETLALIGGLGSGKTAFVRALAKRLKVKIKVTSPTFVLMNAYPAVLPKNQKNITLLHLDLYRAKTLREIGALGLEELWQKEDAVTVIEWAQKIKKRLPKNSWIINFHYARKQ